MCFPSLRVAHSALSRAKADASVAGSVRLLRHTLRPRAVRPGGPSVVLLRQRRCGCILCPRVRRASPLYRSASLLVHALLGLATSLAPVPSVAVSALGGQVVGRVAHRSWASWASKRQRLVPSGYQAARGWPCRLTSRSTGPSTACQPGRQAQSVHVAPVGRSAMPLRAG